ncbi:MAG: hypothetical protein ACK550_04655, partial [Synechococcaceae cyanobacterium]
MAICEATSEGHLSQSRRIAFRTIHYYCSEMVEELVESTLAGGDPEIRFVVVDNSPNDPGLDQLAGCSAVT